MAGLKALVKVNPAKVGELLVCKFWFKAEEPFRVKVLVFKVNVPLPAVMVLPFKVVTVKAVAVVVARVEVALTVSPEVPKVKLELVAMGLTPLPNRMSEAVRLAAPVPPLETPSCPCQPKVKALEEMLPVTLVPLVTEVTTLLPREMLVEVPIKTFCPPLMERLLPTVKEPRVLVPVPPVEIPKTPEVIWLAAMPMLVLVTPVISPNWLVVRTGTWEAEP